jgi:ribosomal protein S14
MMSNGKEMKDRGNDHCAECGRYAWLLIPIIYQTKNFNICRNCFARRMALPIQEELKK